MSLNPQRLASIGLICVAVGGLAWSEFSGKPVGPASASASTPSAAVAAKAGSADAAAQAPADDCRVMLAGMLRSYAGSKGLDATSIDDPFIEPASWQPAARATVTQASDFNTPLAQQQAPADVALTLTAVLDSPSGAVALVNGVTLRVGRAADMPGMGLVELIEVGADGRSALIKTGNGVVRVKLNEVIGSPGA